MLSQFSVPALMLMAIFFEGILNAQSSNGYLVGGAGSYNSKLISQAAIGGEKVFGKGIGAGGELGFVAGHTSFGFVSLNGYYHLAHNGAVQKVDPFLTGGYTPAFHLFGSAASGANVGFGLHYWFLPHLGVRAEFRDIVLPGTSPANVWGFRGGIAFR